MEKLKGKYLKLTKQEDLKFGGNHPNNINKGYVLRGWCVNEPIIGEQLFLYMSNSLAVTPNAWTSRLVNIDMENMILETKNSKYSIEIDEDAEDITLEVLQKAFSKSKIG
jgi:hypothetical protein